MYKFLSISINRRVIFSKGNFDYPAVYLNFHVPSVNSWKWEDDGWGGQQRDLGISFPTLINVQETQDVSKQITFRVLGFGFTFAYQYGY